MSEAGAQDDTFLTGLPGDAGRSQPNSPGKAQQTPQQPQDNVRMSDEEMMSVLPLVSCVVPLYCYLSIASFSLLFVSAAVERRMLELEADSRYLEAERERRHLEDLKKRRLDARMESLHMMHSEDVQVFFNMVQQHQVIFSFSFFIISTLNFRF